MQNITRTNRFGIDLSTIEPYPHNELYVQQVVSHLRNAKQNLAIRDLVTLFSDDLQMSFRDMYAQHLEISCIRHISHSHGLYSGGDVHKLQCLILNSLPSELDTDAYYQNLLTIKIDLPSQSILNPKKLAVWRNTSKMGGIETRQAVSVRKWIGSTLVGLTDEQAETLACKIDKFLQSDSLADLDVRFAPSSAFTMWRDAYESDKIASCMHPKSGCDVGRERTYTTYCTQHHGLPDNKLKLAVLYQDEVPVARAITFSATDGSKCFVRAYGDDRLYKWLISNGYSVAKGYPQGTILYAGERKMKPYLDGNNTVADYRYDAKANEYYWVLSAGSAYDLRTTSAYADESEPCELCHSRVRPADIYDVVSAVNGCHYSVCEGCHEDNTWQVYTGGLRASSVFFHDGMQPDSNSDYVFYDGEYYERTELDTYALKEINGTIYHTDDLCYCEITDAYFISRDDVYTDADDISTTQPVYFPYDCVSREYWDENVVECACGTLALADETKKLGTPSLGDVITLELYLRVLQTKNARGDEVAEFIFELGSIERDYDYDTSEKMRMFMEYAISYNTIQYLRFQELGI